MKKLLTALTRNTVSLIGLILASLSAMLIMALSALAAFGAVGRGGSDLGVLSYVILPATFVLGLALVPAGMWWQRRRERRAALHARAAPPPLPVIDLNDPAIRASVVSFVLVAFGCIVVLGATGYKGVLVLDSTRFCTQACHVVMQPEAVAHARSPHADVACVQCHIGPGARWFVQAKINGLMELTQVVLHDYPRPIPTPIHTLRPAREVCEQCHWPAAFIGDRLVVHTHYGEDENNSPTKTVLLVHVGGQAGASLSGIHWHVGRGVSVRYLSDPSRKHIYTVEVRAPDRTTKTFRSAETPPANAVWRDMDCVDCHNRPAHMFHQPDEEIDAALDDGRIDRSLPFIKREGLRVLQIGYATEAQARSAILRAIEQFYRTQNSALASGRGAAVVQAGAALGDIWSWNVFPQMKVTWDTYPDHLGHEQSPGCWRCHDNRHVAQDGTRIGKQCNLCHNIVSEGEAAPDVLKELQ